MTLHREFVGMLFALVIAQVAVRSSDIVNSDLDTWTKAPALAHLLLAATIVSTSWVGWGLSKHSLSPVRHVFTRDFIELVLDVWLVGVYFFIVQGVEATTEPDGTLAIHGSTDIEALWVLVMFVTYLVWDVWTKWEDRNVLWSRGLPTLGCTVLAVISCIALHGLRGVEPVLLANAALLTLVLLFRGWKAYVDKQTKRSILVLLSVLWLAFTLGAYSWPESESASKVDVQKEGIKDAYPGS